MSERRLDDMIGQTVSHYRVLEKLGGGGMGVVYKTEDIVRSYVEEYTIRFFAFESGEVTELFRKEGPFNHARLAVSPDEEWLLYGEAPADTSELMLVENFR